MKISVIVPVYNTEQYLEECLNSIFNQTYKDFEVILVDDGSTDKSFDILKKYEKDPRCKIYQKENGGQASARNLGIKEALGKYITFVDSDDYIDKNMFEDLYKCAASEDADIVISDIIKVKENNFYPFKNYHEVTSDKVRNYMTSHMGPVARLYKRSLFIQNDIFFKENVIYEDLATIPLIGIYAKKVSYINKEYYYYRIRTGSTMKQTEYNKKFENIFEIMDYLSLEFAKRSGNDYHEELEFLYIEHLLYGSSLRFLTYHKKDLLIKIKNIMKEKYPKFYNNKYYKNMSIKFRIVCRLFYNGNYKIVSILKKGKKDL